MKLIRNLNIPLTTISKLKILILISIFLTSNILSKKSHSKRSKFHSQRHKSTSYSNAYEEIQDTVYEIDSFVMENPVDNSAEQKRSIRARFYPYRIMNKADQYFDKGIIFEFYDQPAAHIQSNFEKIQGTTQNTFLLRYNNVKNIATEPWDVDKAQKIVIEAHFETLYFTITMKVPYSWNTYNIKEQELIEIRTHVDKKSTQIRQEIKGAKTELIQLTSSMVESQKAIQNMAQKEALLQNNLKRVEKMKNKNKQSKLMLSSLLSLIDKNKKNYQALIQETLKEGMELNQLSNKIMLMKKELDEMKSKQGPNNEAQKKKMQLEVLKAKTSEAFVILRKFAMKAEDDVDQAKKFFEHGSYGTCKIFLNTIAPF